MSPVFASAVSTVADRVLWSDTIANSPNVRPRSIRTAQASVAAGDEEDGDAAFCCGCCVLDDDEAEEEEEEEEEEDDDDDEEEDEGGDAGDDGGRGNAGALVGGRGEPPDVLGSFTYTLPVRMM